MGNLKFKYQNFDSALGRLIEVCKVYDGVDSIVRDSVIQRFEFTYTVTMSLLKEYLNDQGIVLDNSFPKYLLQVAYTNQLIDDEKGWLMLVSDRNMTSHIYNENLAIQIADRVVKQHLSLFLALRRKLGNH